MLYVPLNETVRGREEIRLSGGRAQEREGMLARGERLKEAGIRQSTDVDFSGVAAAAPLGVTTPFYFGVPRL